MGMFMLLDLFIYFSGGKNSPENDSFVYSFNYFNKLITIEIIFVFAFTYL